MYDCPNICFLFGSYYFVDRFLRNIDCGNLSGEYKPTTDTKTSRMDHVIAKQAPHRDDMKPTTWTARLTVGSRMTGLPGCLKR